MSHQSRPLWKVATALMHCGSSDYHGFMKRWGAFAWLAVAGSSLFACSNGSGCSPAAPTCALTQGMASSLAGTWTQVSAANGISLQFQMAARDTTLTGTGTYTAGSGGGAVQLTGFVFWQQSGATPGGGMSPAGPSVVVDVTFDNGTSTRLDQATLVGQDTLRGVLNFASGKTFTSYLVSFARTGR